MIAANALRLPTFEYNLLRLGTEDTLRPITPIHIFQRTVHAAQHSQRTNE